MSWILNSMEHNLAKIFSYAESSLDFLDGGHNMYGNQNNSTWISQIHQDITSLHYDGKLFVSLQGSLKGL